jgi:nucleoside-diphosphate-sugar epimerase
MTKVLITGADGFIGSHLPEILLGQTYYVKDLSYYTLFNCLRWLDDISNSDLEIII